MECKHVLDIPPKTWSNGVRSGDLVGQEFCSTAPIHSPNQSSNELSHCPITPQLIEKLSSPAEYPLSAAATTSSLTCQDSTCNGGLSSKMNNPPTFCSDSAQNCHLWRVIPPQWKPLHSVEPKYDSCAYLPCPVDGNLVCQ